MPSDPIIEQIAQNLKSAVSAITTANGFQQDLTCVRPLSNDWESNERPRDNLVLLVQMPATRDDAISTAGNSGLYGERALYELQCYVCPGDDSTTPIDTLLNRIRADVRKKLMEDPTRGGLAIDTEFEESVPFEHSQGISGLALSFAVRFRTPFDDPYTGA